MKKVTILISLLGLISLNAFSQYLFTMEISANKIKYDTKRDLIYATVKGIDANYANSIVAINPYTGNVSNNIFIGSEPNDFEFTTDSNYIFISFDEQPMVKKFSLESFTVVQDINLGIDPSDGSYYAKSLATLPNNDSSIVVCRYFKGTTAEGGTAVYVNGVQHEEFMDDWSGPDELITTGSDTLYGITTGNTSYAFYSIHVSVDTGVSMLSKGDFLSLKNAKYDEGLLFDDKGLVIDPSIPAQIGKFQLEDTWEAYPNQSDSKNNKVFFCMVSDNDTDLEFYSYNRTTFAKEADYNVPNIISSDYHIPEASQLIRFGEKGLAALIYDDYSFSDAKPFITILNNSSFVDSIAPSDTSELAQLFILDTLYTYEHITVYDTLDVYNYVTVYDTTHLSTTDTLIVYQTTTNVNGNIIKSEISLYPNPASNYINVEISNSNVIENYNIKLYNTVGELFFDSQLTSDLLTIDISSYSKGTYILTLTDNWGQMIATKYVVVK